MAAKHEMLKTLGSHYPVPTLICIENKDFDKLLTHLDAASSRIAEIYKSIKVTSGCFLNNDLENLAEALNTIEWQDCSSSYLNSLCNDAFGHGWEEEKLAVRSSSTAEDNARHSFAGVFESVLNVQGLAEVQSAILKVWKSAHSKSSILERLHNGCLEEEGAMSVIIQRMVKPTWSGIAFSRDPVTGAKEPIMEVTRGLADELVSGFQSGTLLKFGQDGRLQVPPEFSDEDYCELHLVFDLLANVENRLGYPIDMEWATDDRGPWILQVRPLTNLKVAPKESESSNPIFEYAPLYGNDSALTSTAALPEFAAYFRKKRKPLFDFANRNGLNVAPAYVFRMNGIAFANRENAALFLALFSDVEQVVIDFNDRIRQLIIKRHELVAQVSDLLAEAERIYCFVIRAFVKGDFGMISRTISMSHPPKVAIEWSADGLLAINRGLADTSTYVSGEGETRVCDKSLDPNILKLVTDATLGAQIEIGNIQIEWVCTSSNKLYPVDFSRIENSIFSVQRSSEDYVVSEGFSRGKVIHINDLDKSFEMQSISPSISVDSIPSIDELGGDIESLFEYIRHQESPPILVAARPLAIYSVLLDLVGGFVFEKSSILCHLAILMRERGLVAVSSSHLFNTLRAGECIELEARGGKISCART